MGVNLVCVGDSLGVAACVGAQRTRTCVSDTGDKRAFQTSRGTIRGHFVTPSRYFVQVLSSLVNVVLKVQSN